jgi:2-C-methyl-D-erythritol 4-phosphate cytidylyltransferase
MSGGVAAIILAGGSGSRMQKEINKVYLPISNRDMLEFSIETMDRSPFVERIVLVVRDEDRPNAEMLIAETMPSKLTDVVTGGSTRHESEAAGLEQLAGAIEDGSIELVAIHDGARPFMTLDLLESVITAARETGGAVPGLEVEEPLFRQDGGEVELLEQTSLRRMQTPQAFHARPLLLAYRRAGEAGFQGVDTAETIERFSDLAITVVPGDPHNIKVTFVEDFFEAEGYALQFEKGRWKA